MTIANRKGSQREFKVHYTCIDKTIENYKLYTKRTCIVEGPKLWHAKFTKMSFTVYRLKTVVNGRWF